MSQLRALLDLLLVLCVTVLKLVRLTAMSLASATAAAPAVSAAPSLAASSLTAALTCSTCHASDNDVLHFSASAVANFVPPPCVSNTADRLHVGDLCDCLYNGTTQWLLAKVIRQESTRLQISYCGWSTSVPEWVPADSQRIQPPHTQTNGYTGPAGSVSALATAVVCRACAPKLHEHNPFLRPVHNAVSFTSALPAALSSVQVFTLTTDGEESLKTDSRISSSGDTFVPVQLMEGADGTAQVLFRSATRVKQFVTRVCTAEEQLHTMQKRRSDADATLRELREALPRSMAAVAAAVAGAAAGSSDLVEIGALTVEQYRIQAEITRQEGLEKSSAVECTRLQTALEAEIQNPRYQRRLETEAAQLTLQLGHAKATQLDKKLYVVKRKLNQYTLCQAVATQHSEQLNS